MYNLLQKRLPYCTEIVSSNHHDATAICGWEIKRAALTVLCGCEVGLCCMMEESELAGGCELAGDTVFEKHREFHF